MTNYQNCVSAIVLCLLTLSTVNPVYGSDNECFESRDGMSQITQYELNPGQVNVKCSQTTGGVLWWGDPFDDTIPMGDMEVEADYTHEEAVIKSR
ncbi:MAG: hypothetical protein ABW158_06350, partial [Candidatus Thiodiazotropha sp. 6PDIVS]